MKARVGIVGAGIVGLAQAWSAAERGHQVTVFEKSSLPCGASIRNFGMVWPMGQPDSTRSMALLSRDRWLKLAHESDIWVNRCGSIHLAHRVDEWDVLQEFYEIQRESDLGPYLQLLGRDECLQRSKAINSDGFIGGLYSSLELCVNPALTIRSIPDWLQSRFAVQFQFESTVVEVREGKLQTSEGYCEHFDRIIICSGHDFETLFPTHFRQKPMQKCKLQMMRTIPQAEFEMGPHLASGLTLRHYSSFDCCQTLPALVQRIASETPELNEFGIHVLASQDNMGRVVLGDSHEYGYSLEPFDSAEIDVLILRELQKIIRLPSWRMESHWHGKYAKMLDGSPACVFSPEPDIHVCTGLGGAGMTLSFGLAESLWRRWDDEYS